MTSTTRPERQAPGVYHRMVGDIAVTALNDGMFQGSFELLAEFDPAEAERLHRACFRAVPPNLTVNSFLLHLPDGRRVLVDSGCGGHLGPALGKLEANLAVLGVTPAEVDVVLATHLHPDHAGGLTDAEGAALFPAAELVVHAAEARFWRDDAVLAGAASDQDRMFVGLARQALAAHRDRTREIASGEVLPGITAIPASGHTPGHTGWLIASGGELLLIWGDIVHLPGIQFARPQAGLVFDVDRAAAIATRRRMMDMAAADRLLVAGMHLDFPAFGHVARAAEGYAFVPEVWTPWAEGA